MKNKNKASKKNQHIENDEKIEKRTIEVLLRELREQKKMVSLWCNWGIKQVRSYCRRQKSKKMGSGVRISRFGYNI